MGAPKQPDHGPSGRLRRDIWRMADGSWGAEVERNGVGVGLRNVSLGRAVWHVLTVRRPDEFGTLHGQSRSDYEARIREACDDVMADPSEPHRTIVPVAGMFWLRVQAAMNAEFRRRGVDRRV